MINKKLHIILLLSISALLFTACGHRGPLNLPDEKVYFKDSDYERP
tara:strand:+ start:404 stop:541 length:138 start_codon:yes stop_codon:yes gene_type:complete